MVWSCNSADPGMCASEMLDPISVISFWAGWTLGWLCWIWKPSSSLWGNSAKKNVGATPADSHQSLEEPASFLSHCGSCQWFLLCNQSRSRHHCEKNIVSRKIVSWPRGPSRLGGGVKGQGPRWGSGGNAPWICWIYRNLEAFWIFSWQLFHETLEEKIMSKLLTIALITNDHYFHLYIPLLTEKQCPAKCGFLLWRHSSCDTNKFKAENTPKQQNDLDNERNTLGKMWLANRIKVGAQKSLTLLLHHPNSEISNGIFFILLCLNSF